MSNSLFFSNFTFYKKTKLKLFFINFYYLFFSPSYHYLACINRNHFYKKLWEEKHIGHILYKIIYVYIWKFTEFTKMSRNHLTQLLIYVCNFYLQGNLTNSKILVLMKLYTHIGGVNRWNLEIIRCGPKTILRDETTLYVKRSFLHLTIYLENYVRYQKMFHTKVLWYKYL